MTNAGKAKVLFVFPDMFRTRLPTDHTWANIEIFWREQEHILVVLCVPSVDAWKPRAKCQHTPLSHGSHAAPSHYQDTKPNSRAIETMYAAAWNQLKHSVIDRRCVGE